MSELSRRRVLAAGALSAAWLGLGGRIQAAEPQRTLRLGFIGASKVPTAPSGWALHSGLLQQHLAPLGFDDFSTHAFPNGPDLNEALLAGALDIGTYGDTPALVGYASGHASRLISLDVVGTNVWLVTPKNGVRSIADLKGKVVATALGSYMHRYLIGALQAAGILNDTRIVYMLGRDAEPALARGDIAAFAAQTELGPTLVGKGYPVIDQATDHPALRGCSVTVASEPVLQRAPQLPAAWNAARQAAVAQISADWPAYYRFHAQVSGFPQASIEASYTAQQFQPEAFPASGLQLLQGTKEFLLEQRLIRRDFDIKQWTI